jgi:hypothetical protein
MLACQPRVETRGKVRTVVTKSDGGPRHHVAIAGTGRAGSSFLVRFFAACGLDVGPPGEWYDRARAGLESYLLDEAAPYVVKDPSLFTYCDEVDPSAVVVDALIVPMRDLSAAAISRVLQERIGMAENTYWRDRPPREVRDGPEIGGVIYSLDPVDQARLLAVGFHQLVYWATVREIPLFLLEFPRIVADRDYLVENLWPWLQTHCTKDQARSAFEATADPSAVRVTTPTTSSLRTQPLGTAAPRDPDISVRLDRDAMAALLNERDSRLAAMEEQISDLQHRLLQAEDLQHRLSETEGAFTQTQDRLTETEVTLTETEGTLAQTQNRLAETEKTLAETRAEVTMLRQSSSWRITGPLRALTWRRHG